MTKTETAYLVAGVLFLLALAIGIYAGVQVTSSGFQTQISILEEKLRSAEMRNEELVVSCAGAHEFQTEKREVIPAVMITLQPRLADQD